MNNSLPGITWIVAWITWKMPKDTFNLLRMARKLPKDTFNHLRMVRRRGHYSISIIEKAGNWKTVT